MKIFSEIDVCTIPINQSIITDIAFPQFAPDRNVTSSPQSCTKVAPSTHCPLGSCSAPSRSQRRPKRPRGQDGGDRPDTIPNTSLGAGGRWTRHSSRRLWPPGPKKPRFKRPKLRYGYRLQVPTRYALAAERLKGFSSGSPQRHHSQ